MSELTEFLLARIAEDEAKWKGLEDPRSANYSTHDPDCDFPGDMPGCCNCTLVARLLAECEAKRRIVEHLAAYGRDGIDDFRDGYTAGMEDSLRFLALPCADHPDFRAEWRP